MNWSKRHMFRSLRASRAITVTVLILFAISTVSCQKEQTDLLTVYPARGQVFVNDQPAENAEIFFFAIGIDNQRTGASQAVVDKDGWYELSTYKNKDGAPEGKFIVTIVWPIGSKPPDEGFEASKMPPRIDRLNGLYAKPDRSSLRMTIPRGGRVLETIRLEVKPDSK